MPSHRHTKVLLTLATASAVLAGCGGSSKANPTPGPFTSPPATPIPSINASTPVTVLVTNDDGVHAEGINAVVVALQKQPGVTIKVVGPATNQSGTGGKTSATTPSYTTTTTLSGYPAVAVAGTPADSVNVAYSKLSLKPDLVISGVNAGQNLGPVVDLSGTVGAARAAAKHGIPTLAVSSGIATKIDFTTGAEYAIKWLQAERAGRMPVTPTSVGTVTGINVPSCTTGKVRGELVVDLQSKANAGESAIGPSNCESAAKPTTELAAFADGYATLISIPLEPSS